MVEYFQLLRALTATVLLSAAATALAAEPSATQSAPTKEMREKMATIHQNMAACLRSDRAHSSASPPSGTNLTAVPNDWPSRLKAVPSHCASC